MNRLTSLLALTLTLASTGTMAYSINGSSDSGFVLKCNDGTTNTSVMPPNHNTAVEFCKDHGGIAAGYPKPIISNAKASPQSSATNSNNTDTQAQDYNSSRSNR